MSSKAKLEAEKIFKDCVVHSTGWNKEYIDGVSIQELKSYTDFRWHRCKALALYVVDTVLNAATTIADRKYDFWLEVKKELKNI